MSPQSSPPKLNRRSLRSRPVPRQSSPRQLPFRRWAAQSRQFLALPAVKPVLFSLVLSTITFLVIDKIFLESVQQSVGLLSWFFVVVAAVNLGFCYLMVTAGAAVERVALGYMSVWFASGLAAGVFDENVTSPLSLLLVVGVTVVLWYYLLWLD